MSSLPQRKKTAEEIAKLREDMGMPSVMPAAAVSHTALERAALAAEQSAPEEPRPVPEARPVRSLKRSEREPRPEARRTQAPAQAPTTATGTNPAIPGVIPAHRHSERDLERIRRQEAMRVSSMEVPPAVSHLQRITAHPALLVAGYLLAFAGGAGAFPVALYIAITKPRSRHHAGFMAVIALFACIILAFRYFPNLNPAHAP